MPKRRHKIRKQALLVAPKKDRKAAAKRAWATRRARAAALPHVHTGAPVGLLEAPPPIRAQVLDAAKALTMGDRNKLYGSPRLNLQTQGELRDAFWKAAGMDYQYTPWGSAMEMVLCKLARIASAPNRETQLNTDHVKDAINYLAISLEVA